MLDKIRKEWKELTLHNIKEYNFKEASEKIRKMKKYPENLGFIE
jgi:hypothetical protein